MLNLHAVNLALALSLGLSVFIPLISALLSDVRLPQEITGLITLGISLLNGFLLDWTHATNIHNFDWKDALGVAAGSWLLAAVGQVVLWAQTKSSSKLLAKPGLFSVFVPRSAPAPAAA